jgi:CubicO group peptidase (beta-lactamase class C family)
VGALDLIRSWPVPTAAAVVIVGDSIAATEGPTDHRFRLASLTKPIAAWAMLIAVEEGVIGLDSPVGQPECTLRHLLAHAGGYAFDGPPMPIAAPARTRIYSNTGFELAADAIARSAEMSFADYLELGVFEPLAMTSSRMQGTAAHGVWSTVDDVARFLADVRRPTLLSEPTAAAAIQPHFPDLGGIVPGVGRFETCPWGLGFEIRGEKTPHWTGSLNSPATSGHFGGAGTMMWFDPVHDLAVAAVADRPFDEWAAEALRRWPELSDAVIEEFAGAA